MRVDKLDKDLKLLNGESRKDKQRLQRLGLNM